MTITIDERIEEILKRTSGSKDSMREALFQVVEMKGRSIDERMIGLKKLMEQLENTENREFSGRLSICSGLLSAMEGFWSSSNDKTNTDRFIIGMDPEWIIKDLQIDDKKLWKGLSPIVVYENLAFLKKRICDNQIISNFVPQLLDSSQLDEVGALIGEKLFRAIESGNLSNHIVVPFNLCMKSSFEHMFSKGWDGKINGKLYFCSALLESLDFIGLHLDKANIGGLLHSLPSILSDEDLKEVWTCLFLCNSELAFSEVAAFPQIKGTAHVMEGVTLEKPASKRHRFSEWKYGKALGVMLANGLSLDSCVENVKLNGSMAQSAFSSCLSEHEGKLFDVELPASPSRKVKKI